MGARPTRIRIAAAIALAVVIVAVPHLLTVDRGESAYDVGTGAVHRCPPLPDSQTFRIAVRNVTCDDGTAVAQEVLSSPRCRTGFCQTSADYACNRTVREGGRLFWLCRIAGGGAKVRFVIAKGT